MGSFLTGQFASAVKDHLSPQARAAIPKQVLDKYNNPQVLLSTQAHQALQQQFARLPHGQALLVQLTSAIRVGLADALHQVYIVGLVIAVLATIAALFLKEIPLRGRSMQDPQQSSQAA
ncbi:MAG TPA: hypothetical protein VHB98_13875 [Chloroflexota bacterium]|jgi:hypothetical protein|nr:hypothetical protein [Chloroflexota bacterium]